MTATLQIIELVYEATQARGCFGCGGEVMSGHEPDTGLPVSLCGRCGEVTPWVEADRHGHAVHGFLPRADAARWPVPQRDGNGTIALVAGDPS
jgi:ribosomal protein S27AE